MSNKKLAVFIDGTWNSADQKTCQGKPCPTNITKLFEATLPRSRENQLHQIAHYVRGVGTRKLERLQGGGFGYGISDNIKEAYQFLVSNYEPGDDIYIFGFSRGAYAARSLAGMIRNVGLLKREKLIFMEEAYQKYKDDRDPDWHPNGEEAKAFRDNHTWGDVTIKFLGVFDTVGSLGAPFGLVLGWIVNKIFNCSFHDTQLSAIVESAYHALAVDEFRLPFMPTLMTRNAQDKQANFEQKWFPGVHSDIGGGYPNTGLSDLALEWMADKAGKHGLSLDLQKIANPAFAPDVKDSLNHSQTWFYRITSVLWVKLPGYIGLIPEKYKSALSNIGWNGDYIRPIDNKGDVAQFIGNPTLNQDLAQYIGDLHLSVIDKIKECENQYLPVNVIDNRGSHSLSLAARIGRLLDKPLTARANAVLEK